MFMTIAFIAGVLVGWHVPRPEYAKTLTTKFFDWLTAKLK